MNSNLFSGNLTFKKQYENESSEDNYVSPQDISIKDEQIWDPTDEEIIAYAAKLGYDIEKDPDELFEVAYYYMKYPLPEGWKRGIMKTSKELVYINLVDGEIELSTEIEEMAHQMYLEKKAEMNQKNIFKKTPEKEKTTVVPRKKIPPLNPLQKSNNSNGLKGSLPSIKDLNSNKKSNANNINNPNNPLQIERPELEPSSNFNLLEFIKIGIVGRGTEGIIYVVKWKKNNKKYALKKGIIKLMEVVKKRQEEINMLKEFRKKTGSDGVINIYGYLCVTNKLNYFDFYEIMELAEIDWEQEIEQRGKLRIYYPEYELMNIMYQIVHTFSLLQKNHITHRDIKPQNIIIVKGKYKVIDFGNARILKRDGLVIQRIRGSEMYMSPVMFKGYHAKMPRVKHNTFKSDVFSLGMCFLLAASLSYTPLNTIREEYDINIINNIVRSYIGTRYSDKVYSIIFSMLQIEENLRPDFIQLEQYFKQVNDVYKL